MLATTLSAGAATYEVGTGKPFTTIQSALDQAQADLVNNVYNVPATITVYSGTYTEKVFVPADPTNNQFVSTKYDNWTLQAAPGANVLLKGHLMFGVNKEGMTIDGINIDNSNPGDADIDLGSAINFDAVTSRDNVVKNLVIYGYNDSDNAIRGNFSYGSNTLDHVTIYATDYGLTGNSNSSFIVKNSIVANTVDRGFFSTQPSSVLYSDIYGCNPNYGGGQSNDGGNLNFPTGSDPMFVTTDPNSPYFLWLNPSSPAAGTAQSGTNMGAKPVFDPRWGVNADGNWPVNGSWMFNLQPNGVNAKAIFGDVITAQHTVSLTSAVTAGHLVFDNANSYIVAGANALTLQVSTGSADITVNSGSHTISAPVNFNSNTTIAVTSAGSTLTLQGQMSAGAGVTITKNGSGTLVAKNVRSAGLFVSTGTLRISADGSAAGASKVTSLTIAGAAKLDLSNNKLITAAAVGTWNGSNYDGVTGLIKAGRNGGGWDGSTGIITSQSAAIVGNLTTLGVATAAQVKGIAATATATFAGQTVSGSDTLVMYTYGGDANLDGKINVDDYTRIDFNVPLGASGWYNGDFNYDGKINVDDYTIIDFNVGIQGAPFSTGAEVISSLTAVPEPASLALVGIALVGLLGRRRRTRSL